MSTFQNFRKSHQLNKSNSRISKSSEPLNLVNVEFSTNQIVFHYEQGLDTLINSELSIANYGVHGVYFRIVSNNAQYYEISPSQDILYSSAKVNIVFRLKKNMLSINHRESYTNTLEKVVSITKKHLFLVQWAMITDEELRQNKIPDLKYEQTFAVKVVEPYSNDKNYNHYKRQSYSRFDQEKILSSRSPSGFNSSREEYDKEVGFQSQDNIPQNNETLLRTPIIATVAVISFLIGFISA